MHGRVRAWVRVFVIRVLTISSLQIVFVEDAWELEGLKDKYGFTDDDVQVLGPR